MGWLDTIEEKIIGGIRRNNTKCNRKQTKKMGRGVRDMRARIRWCNKCLTWIPGEEDRENSAEVVFGEIMNENFLESM